MKPLNSPPDALPLLACKIAPRQFDLSYRFSSISLRDQIVRAQTLIRTLFEQGLVAQNADETGRDFQLLIVGAGAAGLAAAKEASACGVSFVLIEKSEDAPGGVLHSTAQRYVSTAMYEWPHPNHTQHKFPLATPKLLGNTDSPSLELNIEEPLTVKEFGAVLTEALQPNIKDWTENGALYFAGKKLSSRELFFTKTSLDEQTKGELLDTLAGHISIHGIPLNDTNLPEVILEVAGARTGPFKFEYIIYAVGFGTETRDYAEDKVPYDDYKHVSFWEPDLIFSENLGFGNPPSIGILGSGDGALQDALRCLVDRTWPHPLAIWDEILAHEQGRRPPLKQSRHIDKALAKVAAADGYTTGGAIWTSGKHIFESLDQVFKDIVSELVQTEGYRLRRAIRSMLRKDVKKVTLITLKGHFTKAYALNRFLIYLFHKILEPRGKNSQLEILAGEVVSFEEISGNKRGAKLQIAQPGGAVEIRICDLAIIRGGLDTKTAPTQLVGLTGIDTGRAELGRIPPAIRSIGEQP